MFINIIGIFLLVITKDFLYRILIAYLSYIVDSYKNINITN